MNCVKHVLESWKLGFIQDRALCKLGSMKSSKWLWDMMRGWIRKLLRSATLCSSAACCPPAQRSEHQTALEQQVSGVFTVLRRFLAEECKETFVTLPSITWLDSWVLCTSSVSCSTCSHGHFLGRCILPMLYFVGFRHLLNDSGGRAGAFSEQLR